MPQRVYYKVDTQGMNFLVFAGYKYRGKTYQIEEVWVQAYSLGLGFLKEQIHNLNCHKEGLGCQKLQNSEYLDEPVDHVAPHSFIYTVSYQKVWTSFSSYALFEHKLLVQLRWVNRTIYVV